MMLGGRDCRNNDVIFPTISVFLFLSPVFTLSKEVELFDTGEENTNLDLPKHLVFDTVRWRSEERQAVTEPDA
jgi:hypothetical protein